MCTHSPLPARFFQNCSSIKTPLFKNKWLFSSFFLSPDFDPQICSRDYLRKLKNFKTITLEDRFEVFINEKPKLRITFSRFDENSSPLFKSHEIIKCFDLVTLFIAMFKARDIDVGITWISNFKKFILASCNWTPTWSRADYATNRRARTNQDQEFCERYYYYHNRPLPSVSITFFT